jgi:hypothetical protein
MGTNTTEWMRNYMREYRAAGRDNGKRRNLNANRPFSGCDGEGATIDSGYHAYFMLRMGQALLNVREPSVRLTTIECLDFISRQDPKAIHVGYFFDYDNTKLLEDMPWQKLDRLVNRAKRTGLTGEVWPVDYAGFQVDYLPRKFLRVRRQLSQVDDKTTWSPWIEISDVGPFFQTSFLDAITTWDVGTPEERELIRVGKLQRATFNVEDFDEIARYNALEIRLLQQLMDRFRAACVSAGYVPRKWQGPGLLAETMLQAHGVRKTKDIPLLSEGSYAPLVEFARNAYYGGRFEIAHVGPVSHPVYQYDINSAYPAAMRVLPCLEHGKWEHVKGSLPTGRVYAGKPRGIKGERLALMYGSFERTGAPTLWYGLPIRTPTGGIVYPASGRGWYWSFEIRSAVHQRFTCEEAWVYTRVCDCQPLGFVSDVYKKRKALGKDGPGIVLKLGLNSLYGKMVQSIGSPKYANPIWGSYITAYPRMMIQDLIHSSPMCVRASRGRVAGCGRDIVMVATDSVASLIERQDADISGELGAWSCETHPDGMLVVQPGVYFGTSGKHTKTRGFTRTVVDNYESEFRRAFRRMVDSGDLNEGQVALPVQVFGGIRYALQRRNMSFLGQWMAYGTSERTGKVLSFDWTTKRHPMTLNPTRERPWILTMPYEGDPSTETVPYSKNIGGLIDAADDRLAFADLPDWSPLGAVYE